jgi:hypothetical protein
MMIKLCRLVNNYRSLEDSYCSHLQEKKMLRSFDTKVAIYQSTLLNILQGINLYCVRILYTVHV